jgi:hypothetical protein
MTQFSNQISGNILGQSVRNKRSLENINSPDTDSRAVELAGMGSNVTPDLMNDHTRMSYTVPVNNFQPVNFNGPVNKEERSLHILVLDNSNSGTAKDFNFSADYIFLDDPSNITNSYTVTAGKKQVWYGTIVDGKFDLRVASESTN